MAQGRPISRHGRHEPFRGMQMASADVEVDDFYRNVEYQSSRPKSGYKKRGSVTHYDQYARVPDSSRSQDRTPREDPPARPVSRRGIDGPRTEHRQSLDDSDDSYSPSPPCQPQVSPDGFPPPGYQSHHGSALASDRPPSQPPSHPARPPTGTSRRTPSAASSRMRSARTRRADTRQSHFDEAMASDDLPDMPAIRPPSSFSKYRPLPAIGTPTPSEHDSPYMYINQDEDSSLKDFDPDSMPQLHRIKRDSISSRVSSAISDISVISSKPNTSRKFPEDRSIAEFIERLDLSQLDRPPPEATRRRKTSSSSSPAHKPKLASQPKIPVDAGELYDGDDDDSDTLLSAHSKKEQLISSQNSAISSKQPVVIPSENVQGATDGEKEILLAVKLPTDGTRHQRYFSYEETLQSIVEFAEEQAGQDFAGYILISAATKQAYDDLDLTIHKAGLEDKTVLHLEEED